jgi:hypothetical protein
LFFLDKSAAINIPKVEGRMPSLLFWGSKFMRDHCFDMKKELTIILTFTLLWSLRLNFPIGDLSDLLLGYTGRH